jgi:hypothetical protein
MKNINKYILLSAFTFVTAGFLYWNAKHQADLQFKISQLETVVANKNEEIQSLQIERDSMKDIIEEEEFGIGYWGRLYDEMKHRHPGSAVEIEKQIKQLYGFENCEGEDY